MDFRPLIALLCLLAFAALAFGLDRLIRWMRSAVWLAPPTKQNARKSVGHAMLGLQQFIDPRTEHIVEAQHVEEKAEGGLSGDPDDEAIVRSSLADALRQSSVSAEEVRRCLAAAVRAGLDWKIVYDEATRAELLARPYRAPSLPPPARVAP
jgi:hypothetical protein